MSDRPIGVKINVLFKGDRLSALWSFRSPKTVTQNQAKTPLVHQAAWNAEKGHLIAAPVAKIAEIPIALHRICSPVAIPSEKTAVNPDISRCRAAVAPHCSVFSDRPEHPGRCDEARLSPHQKIVSHS